MDFLIDVLKTSGITVTSVINFVIWLLCEWWIIRRILQSKLVKSEKERELWIIFCLATFFIGMGVFYFVTNKRRREKYYYHRSDNNSDKTGS